ncbi:putative core domain protein, partial [Escherichia coli 96.0107]
MFPAELVR